MNSVRMSKTVEYCPTNIENDEKVYLVPVIMCYTVKKSELEDFIRILFPEYKNIQIDWNRNVVICDGKVRFVLAKPKR